MKHEFQPELSEWTDTELWHAAQRIQDTGGSKDPRMDPYLAELQRRRASTPAPDFQASGPGLDLFRS